MWCIRHQIVNLSCVVHMKETSQSLLVNVVHALYYLASQICHILPLKEQTLPLNYLNFRNLKAADVGTGLALLCIHFDLTASFSCSIHAYFIVLQFMLMCSNCVWQY
jgi:hypothetical protein